MNAAHASATAKLIAAATVMRRAAGDLRGCPPAGAAAWCERFLSTTRGDRLLLRSIRSAPGRAWWRFAESVTIPGVVSHWMRRKRAIDRLVRRAATEGFTQLIVLGAGLDTLAFRLGQEGLYEHIISADHPATLAVVRAATFGHPGSPGPELIPLDLAREDACAVLTALPAFDAARWTVVVVEGVLMYLPESAVGAVLRSLAGLPTPRARLIASWMVAESGRPIGFAGQSPLVRAWLRWRGEPMLWGSTPETLPGFLANLGWRHANPVDLAAEDPADDAWLPQGERLVLAERRAPV